METKPELKKITWKQGCLFAIIAFVVIIITLGFLISGDSANQEESKPWETKTYEEKQQWIEEYLKSPDDDGYRVTAIMDSEIKSRFQYPKEVEFDVRPTFHNAKVVEADSGWVFVSGTGTSKNGFGVKNGFSYQCKLKINPNTCTLLDVQVSEHR